MVARGSKPFLGIPGRGDLWGWSLIAQAILGAVVVISGLKTALTSPALGERLASPGSVLILVLASALLLRVAPSWASVLRFTAVGLIVLVFATAAWAVPDPAGVVPWLQRNAWLFVVLAAVSARGVVSGRGSSRSGDRR